MARYVTRVELHHGGQDDYKVLHSAMEAEGFRRTITASNGTEYYLPTAEYYLETQWDRTQVLDAAKRAAAKTNKSFAALVTDAPVSTWSGLTPVSG